VTALHIFRSGNDVRLRASTYGRGIWEIPLTGFTLAVTNATLYAFPNQTASFNATVNGAFNYAFPISLSCQAGATAAPPTCSASPASVTVPGSAQAVAISAGAPTVSDYSFEVTAVGTDPQVLTQHVAVTLHVADFTITGPATAAVGHGDTANMTFTVSPVGALVGTVALSCSGLPAGASCTFSPATVSVSPTQPVTVALGISTPSSLATGAYNISVIATGTLSSGTLVHTQNVTLNVGPDWFLVFGSPATLGTAKPGQPLTANVNVTSNANYAGTINLSCSCILGFGLRGASTCTPAPASVTLLAGDVTPVTVTVNTTGAIAGNPHIEVSGTDAANTSSTVGFDYSIVDYALTVASPAAIVPGGSASMSASVASQNGYSGTVAVTCTVPSPLTCTLTPPGLFVLTGSTAAFTVSVTAPTATPPNTYAVTLNSNDTGFTSLVHAQSVNLGVQDFQLATTPTAAVIKAGDKTTHAISISGLGGFSGSVSFTASQCPTLTTCTFDRSSAGAGSSVTLTIQTTAPSVAQMRPLNRDGAPLWAFWLTMPGAAGVFLLNRGTRRRKLMTWFGLLLVVTALVALMACGGGGGGSTTSPPVPKPGTPAGTYTITVTGISGSGSAAVTHLTQITLTVQ
jgi:hypothetical protein